jgi:hypothetical protein
VQSKCEVTGRTLLRSIDHEFPLTLHLDADVGND